MAKEKYLIGNWKMHKKMQEVEEFFALLIPRIEKKPGHHLGIAPQAIHFSAVKELALASSTPIQIGGQNCSEHPSGPYTGEISPTSLIDMGADFVIIGHSERREHYGEKGLVLRQKFLSALVAGLRVVLCVGEKEGEELQVVEKQLEEILGGRVGEQPKDLLIVAYEPVWAIGSGKSATPEDAQKAHRIIRRQLANLNWPGEKVPLLYGGSVNGNNIAKLVAQEDIDGALVGGASLDGKSFAQLWEKF